jgi:hypothetical protein
MALSNLQILNYVWSREIPTRALAEVAENRQVALKKPRTPSRAQGTLPKIKGSFTLCWQQTFQAALD